MGEPVKILDLAKDVIRLAGLELGVDIDIEYTGLRPGEKMFEELFNDGEEYLATLHEKILYAKNSSEFIPDNLDELLQNLITNYNSLSKEDIIRELKIIVPQFTHQFLNSNYQASRLN
jgi:FlaA1/EpsC-like NDP-sugar epimerase